MQIIEVDQTKLSLLAGSTKSASIDICFDGERVWSVDLRNFDTQLITLIWPRPLLPYLRGSTQLQVRDSATHDLIAETSVKFSDEDCPVSVTDEHGDALAINKWGRLARTLSRQDKALPARILSQTSEIIEVLRNLGKEPFIVGGTLLGAVRDGALLPHDDDADIAYLSEHTNPVDVALEGLRLCRALAEVGYEIEQHSATHIQLQFTDTKGRPSHYIDVFAAFFDADGNINQPFHVRGPMPREQLIPFEQISIGGYNFPRPRDADAWLTLNYDEQWRTPIPGYRLNTPPETRQRFQNWFGRFHLNFDFWQGYYADFSYGADDTCTPSQNWIVSQSKVLKSPVLIDLGSGTGQLSALLTSATRRVIASDFVPLSRKLCQLRGLEYHTINLHTIDTLAAPQRLKITGAFDLVLDHTLGCLPPESIKLALRLCRMALKSGGQVLITEWARFPVGMEGYPRFGAIPKDDLRAVASEFGLRTEFFDIYYPPNSPDAERKPYGVKLSVEDRQVLPEQRRGKTLDRIRNIFRKILHRLLPPTTLSRSELNELRRDHLRISELLDVVEASLLPKPKETNSHVDLDDDKGES